MANGDSKRLSATAQRELIDRVTKEFADKGKIIEGGWTAFWLLELKGRASNDQVREMRKAYFLGAQHLYASIMSFMDEGSEPTDGDLSRMAKIDRELAAFIRSIMQ
jgi:hypothetical protein